VANGALVALQPASVDVILWPPAPVVDDVRVHAPRIVVTSEAYRTTSGGAAATDVPVKKPHAMRNRARMKAVVQLERKYISAHLLLTVALPRRGWMN
jgi:hypothetical protein